MLRRPARPGCATAPCATATTSTSASETRPDRSTSPGAGCGRCSSTRSATTPRRAIRCTSIGRSSSAVAPTVASATASTTTRCRKRRSISGRSSTTTTASIEAPRSPTVTSIAGSSRAPRSRSWSGASSSSPVRQRFRRAGRWATRTPRWRSPMRPMRRRGSRRSSNGRGPNAFRCRRSISDRAIRAAENVATCSPGIARNFPIRRALTKQFRDAGVRLVANIKPCLLDDHPAFAEVNAARGFVADASTGAPCLAQFWDGWGAHLDFTHPAAIDWWQRGLTDAGARIRHRRGLERQQRVRDLGRGRRQCTDSVIRCRSRRARPLQALLMTRATFEAQRRHAPGERVYTVTRAGPPGIQRYAQTWTGDNTTSWTHVALEPADGAHDGTLRICSIPATTSAASPDRYPMPSS